MNILFIIYNIIVYYDESYRYFVYFILTELVTDIPACHSHVLLQPPASPIVLPNLLTVTEMSVNSKVVRTTMVMLAESRNRLSVDRNL